MNNSSRKHSAKKGKKQVESSLVSNSGSMSTSLLGTVPARSLRCMNYKPARPFVLATTVSPAPLIPVQFVFEAKIDPYNPPPSWVAGGYDLKLIDKGFQAWWQRGDGGKKRGRITLGRNSLTLPAVPVFLNGKGTVLTAEASQYGIEREPSFSAFADNPDYITAIPTAVATGDGRYYIPYKVINETDFSHFSGIGV